MKLYGIIFCLFFTPKTKNKQKKHGLKIASHASLREKEHPQLSSSIFLFSIFHALEIMALCTNQIYLQSCVNVQIDFQSI